MKIKHWYTSEEIADICNISTRTVERRRITLLNRNPEIDWFRIKSRPYKYSYKMLSQFISTELFSLVEENRQMANTIECMHRTGTLEQHLSYIDWSYFITIAYKEGLSKTKCFSAIAEAYEYIEAYAQGEDITLFFTTEPFSNRKGHHNHMVLKINGNLNGLSKLLQKHLPIGRVDIQPYDKTKAGIFYICKDGFNGEDWYLNGNNLSEDAITILKNLNKRN